MNKKIRFSVYIIYILIHLLLFKPIILNYCYDNVSNPTLPISLSILPDSTSCLLTQNEHVCVCLFVFFQKPLGPHALFPPRPGKIPDFPPNDPTCLSLLAHCFRLSLSAASDHGCAGGRIGALTDAAAACSGWLERRGVHPGDPSSS